jgi:RNA polymerase sigma factor (sigma-70 family)
MTESRALLSEYAENRTESAFRDLVVCYIDLVYSTALRRVGGDVHLAQDVAQTVFLHLAKKARRLPKNVMLGGWLHQATCNVAATVTRAERRRHLRETQAFQMNTLHKDSTDSMERVAPILDEAISQLPGEDRTAILLRFFERRDFRSIGEAIGSTEDAARMRVNRALDKLQSLMKHRGVTIPVAALATGLAAEAVAVAPAGLALSIAGSALGAGASTSTAFTTLKIMTMTKLKFSIVGTALVAGVAAPLVISHQNQSRLAGENASLRRQVEQLAQTAAENERLSNEVVQANNSQVLTREQASELLRLRGEVGSLRGEKQEWERLQAALTAERNFQASKAADVKGGKVPKESWAFVGYSSPEASLQSVLCAMSKGDVKSFLAGATPETQKLISQQYAGKSESELASSLADEIRGLTELPLDHKKVSPDGTVTFTVTVSDWEDGTARMHDESVMTFENVGGEWKYTLASGTSSSVSNTNPNDDQNHTATSSPNPSK